MDMPPEVINPCSSCHFNSLYFTYLQRLEGCQWNHNKCSSASMLFDETGQWLLLQTPSSKAKSNAAGLSGWQRARACVTQMYERLCWHWLVKLGSSCWLGKPILQQWSTGMNPTEGVGSLHSPLQGSWSLLVMCQGLVLPWKLTWSEILKLLFFSHLISSTVELLSFPSLSVSS